jgi:hypothetical protein
MRRLACPLMACFVPLILVSPGAAQTDPTPSPVVVPADVTLPPATKLEGFTAAAGTIVTLGFDTLRTLPPVTGVTVEVRDIRDDSGENARGLVVRVIDADNRRDFSFVDADEVPSLLAGVDALLQITANPTPFAMFEVRYATRGELQLSVFNSPRGEMLYSVQAGRTVRTQRLLSTMDMTRLRGLLDAANTRLTSTADAPGDAAHRAQ